MFLFCRPIVWLCLYFGLVIIQLQFYSKSTVGVWHKQRPQTKKTMMKRWSRVDACQTIRRWNRSIQISSRMIDYKTGSNKTPAFLLHSQPFIHLLIQGYLTGIQAVEALQDKTPQTPVSQKTKSRLYIYNNSRERALKSR